MTRHDIAIGLMLGGIASGMLGTVLYFLLGQPQVLGLFSGSALAGAFVVALASNPKEWV